MPEFQSNAATIIGRELDAFTKAYIMAAYWTSTGDTGQPDSETPMAEYGREAAVSTCARFQRENAGLLRLAYDRDGYDASRAGHDFWLTRNGHGVGYWDREELEAGDLGTRLTRVAEAMGQSDLYQGDDGLLYFS